MNDHPKTILIVEDSLTQALSLRTLLEKEGLQVVHAENGNEGVKLAHKHLPAAIVLDIEMPGMNGFEVAVLLSKNPETEKIPIIMLTSHDNATALRKGIIMGVIDFIPKDVFAEAVLIETLRQLNILDQDEKVENHE